MPITKSAIKQMRQNRTHCLRNIRMKRTVKTATKAVEAAITDKDSKKAVEALNQAYSILDKTAKRGLYHKNRIARKKARLAKQVAAIKTTKKPASKTKNSKKA